MTIKKFDTINVVPFIDIMLVLLVIVLTTATFVARGIIPIDLSTASSGTKIVKPQTLNISIKNDGKIYFNETLVRDADIKDNLSKFKKDASITIASDKDSSMDNFIKILDILKSNSYTNIGIVTKINK